MEIHATGSRAQKLLVSISKTQVHAQCGPHVTFHTAPQFPPVLLPNIVSTVINNKMHCPPENLNPQMAFKTLQDLRFSKSSLSLSPLYTTCPCSLRLCRPLHSQHPGTPVSASLLAVSSHAAHSLASRKPVLMHHPSEKPSYTQDRQPCNDRVTLFSNIPVIIYCNNK